MSDNRCLLEMEGVCKSFPGVVALDNVSLKVEKGTVHALMGENGAGKSTLMKCLFGVYKKDSGRIYLNGEEVSFKSPADALQGGVAMVHQELNQALKLTVNDNMWLGRYPKVLGLPFLVSDRSADRKTREIFADYGISVEPKAKMSRLSVSKRQMVEIAKAISYKAKIIAFDEPTSSLNETEAEQLFKIIDLLKKQGCGIIYISHKMEEILRISDYVTVMRDGKWIATRPSSEMTVNEIIRLMVGRELTERYPKKENKIGEVQLKVESLSGADTILSDVSFEAYKGEVLGIAGLDGSGRTELCETLFGIKRKSGGRVFLNGKEVLNRTPKESIKNGFALITEERRKNGIFGNLSIRDNTVISNIGAYKRGLLLSGRKMKNDTEKSIERLKVKTPSEDTKIATLSGGNQQKVIFSRWLLTEPTVLMLDEPTRGIDIGAKYEIYGIINRLAKDGKTVIMISSEMPELLGVADRIIVMSGGKKAGEVTAGNATQEKIMQLAAKYV